MNDTELNIFTRYWNEVANLLGGDPKHKSLAISLSEKPFSQFDGVSAVDLLYRSLACDGWRTSNGQNWLWRTEAPAYRTQSPEVALEREIVAIDTEGHWTCQMSTASGVQGPSMHKRRAIDLVEHVGDNQYRFIELKVDSDNPLYAVFEILGYGLAYLHARQSGWKGSGRYDVMQASDVELVVLGPGDWYRHKINSSARQRLRYQLDWLTDALNQGLQSLSGETLRVFLSFDEFTNLVDPTATAKRMAVSKN
jgi:hypothetical protein